MIESRKNILFLGNTPTKDKRSIGGATILTKYLLDELAKDNSLNITIIKTRKRWGKFGQLIDFPLLLFKLPFYLKGRPTVSIHASWDFHLTVGPFVYIICKIFKKKIIYHFFGGNFHKQFQGYRFTIKWWLKRTILNSDFKLMETKKMVVHFRSLEEVFNLIWFPNARKKPKSSKLNCNYKRRFVFISRVTKTKGIDLLFQVVDQLGDSYTIDVFGPLDEVYYKESSFKTSNLNYLGLLQPNEVCDKLLEYDVVVLPTFYKGEGYPGILIEALSLGMPIITTKLNALDEIVQSGYNGQLIEQQSEQELLKAILHFNENNYKDYVLNSLEQFKDFDIENVIVKLKNLY